MNLSAKKTVSLPNLKCLSYALPVISSVMLMAPMAIVQGVYAKHYDISLSVLAVVMLLSRIIDAVSDPIIGHLSDTHRLKYRTRKPIIVFGSILLIVCGYFLYIPIEPVSPLYLTICIIAFYIAYTCFEIPHISWPCDITNQSNDRAKLYSYRVVAGYGGVVLFYLVPLLPIFPTKDITPETLRFTFTVAAILSIPFLIQAMRIVPSTGREINSKSESKINVIKATAKEVTRNKPFLLFLGAFIFGGFALGMWYGLIFIYVDVYLKMGDKFAEMFLVAFIIGILVAPIWYSVSIRYGKKNTWILILILIAFSFIYTGMLDPKKVGLSDLLFLKIIQTSALSGAGVVVPAILSDIVDYSRLKYGSEQSAMYFSIKVFFEKTAGALGTSLALAISAYYGIDVSDFQYTTLAIAGLKIAMAWVPTILIIPSLVFVALMPINEERHIIIQRRLDLKTSRFANYQGHIKR